MGTCLEISWISSLVWETRGISVRFTSLRRRTRAVCKADLQDIHVYTNSENGRTIYAGTETFILLGLCAMSQHFWYSGFQHLAMSLKIAIDFATQTRCKIIALSMRPCQALINALQPVRGTNVRSQA